MQLHGEHQRPGPFSLAKSHGHMRRIYARCICTSSLCQSLSSHMIKDKYYAWAILLSQVNMATLGECLPGTAIWRTINTSSP
jgi:hypothetical protein